MKNIYNEAANTLCDKYGISTQLINSLIEDYNLLSAKNFFEYNDQKVTPKFKLELVIFPSVVILKQCEINISVV